MTDDLKSRLRDALVGTTQGPWTLCAHLRMENENGCTCGYRGVIFAGETEFAICQPGHDVTIGEEGLYPPRLPRSEEIANSRFIAAARDLMPEALDRIEALELALTQSRAETAAAYERAADIAASWVRKAMHLNPNGYDIERLHGKEITSATISAIRALATPDQTAALDAVRAQGMREAAVIAHGKAYVAYEAILSAINKGAKA